MRSNKCDTCNNNDKGICIPHGWWIDENVGTDACDEYKKVEDK